MAGAEANGKREWDPETKAVAIKMFIEGVKVAKIARTLGVNPRTISDWTRRSNPGRAVVLTRKQAAGNAPPAYTRDRDELTREVYDTVLETLRSIRARARATAETEWIRAQTGDALAALDTAQWGVLVRFISSFRVTEDGTAEPAREAEPEAAASAEPELPRNGSVDSTS